MSDVSVLRPLGALDLDTASALHRAAFEPMGERGWTRQDIAGLLSSPGVSGVLLEHGTGDDAGAIGFALCRVAADEAELLTLAVRADRRRGGAGRRLLAAVLDHVRAAGARTLFLEVGADNGPAQALYEAAQFVAVGRRKAYYERGDRAPADALVMQFTLRGA